MAKNKAKQPKFEEYVSPLGDEFLWGDIDSEEDDRWAEKTRKLIEQRRAKSSIFKLVRKKGGPRSGNWGHTGKAGMWGGSNPGGGHSQVSGSKVPGSKPKAQPKKSPPKSRPAEKKPERKAPSGSFTPGRVPGSTSTDRDPKLEKFIDQQTGRSPTMEEIKKYGVLEAERRVERERKNALIESTTGEGSLSEAHAGMLWREASENKTELARGVQRAATREFGVSLSEWQEQYFQENKVGYIGGISPEGTQGWLRKIYNNTQKSLADHGLKPGSTIKLYRGYRARGVSFSPGDIIDYQGNAIESWTADVDVARAYGNVLIEMDVPVENVLSTWHTGFGDAAWEEFVIFGSVEGSRGRVLARFKEMSKETKIIKIEDLENADWMRSLKDKKKPKPKLKGKTKTGKQK